MDYPSRQFRLRKILKSNNRIGILTSLSISSVVVSSRLVHQETICRGQRPTHTALWPLAQVSIVTMDDESSAVVTHHHHRVSCRIDCRRPQILRSRDQHTWSLYLSCYHLERIRRNPTTWGCHPGRHRFASKMWPPPIASASCSNGQTFKPPFDGWACHHG